MNRKSSILLVSIAVFVLALTQFSAQAAAAAHRTLNVKLNYSGVGTVDEKHKIYVLLFDANPFTATKLVDSTSDAAPPTPEAGVSHILRRQGASGKNETVTFSGLSVSPVYAAAIFDQSGSYDGVSDPASGSSTGVYGKALDKAEPITIEEGKTVEVVLSFDDTTKTP